MAGEKGSEVDEDDSRQHLRVQCIGKVSKVIPVAALYVFDHTHQMGSRYGPGDPLVAFSGPVGADKHN